MVSILRALLAWVVLTVVRPVAADPGIGDRAPALDLPGLDGKRVSLPARPVVVDFFATWCEPCHLAMEALGRLVREAGGKVDLVVVDVSEPAERVEAFLASHPLPAGARLGLDASGEAARRWGQHRFPTTFVVDGSGVIRHINRGFGSGYEQRMRGWLRPFLTAP
jgi:cytochrome c biogenesis protein CcmG/thiol:disulfide interchange protein DsbE